MVNGEASTRECGAKASADEVYFGVSRLGRAFIILVIILQAIMAIGFFGMFTVIDFYRVAYMLDPVSIFMAVSEIMLVIVMLATAKYGTKRYWAIFLLSPFVSLSSPFITAILGIFGAIISALLPIGVAIFAFILIVRHDKRVRQPLFVFLFVFMIFAGIANAAFLAGVSWLSFAISFLTYGGVYIVYLVDLATQCSKFSDKSRLLAVTFAIAMMIIPTAIIYSGSFSVKSNIDSPDYRVSSGERLSIDNADPQDDIFIAFNMKYVKGDIRICYFDPSDDCNLETYRYSVQRENNAAPGIIIGNMQNHGSIDGNVYASCFAYAKDFVIKISGASSYSLVIYEEQADNNIVIGDEFQSDTFFINEIFVVEKTGYYDLTLYAPATLKILDENYPDKSAKLSDLGKSVNKVYLQSGKRYFIESEFSEIIELSAKFKGEADGLSHETAYIYDAANYSVQLKKGVPFYLRYNISSPRFSKSMAYRFDGDVNISCSVNAAASVNMPDYIIDFWG